MNLDSQGGLIMSNITERPCMNLRRFAKSADLHKKDLHILRWETKINRQIFADEDARIVFEKITEAIVGSINVVKFISKNFSSFAGYEYAKRVMWEYRNIPKEVRGAQLFFLGTAWKSSSGLYFVPALNNYKTMERDLSFNNLADGIPAASYVH
jgi:hypothetical protein